MNKKIIPKKIKPLNKVPSLPIALTFRSKTKNNNNSNSHNLSSTTNISKEKINSINNSSIINSHIFSNEIPQKKNKNLSPKRIKSFHSNSQKAISKSWIMPDTLNTRKGTFEMIQKADDILMQRLKFHDRDFAIRKKKLKSIALNLNKKISQKNYLINSLKQRRTEITNKEFIIHKSLKEFESKLELDKRRFVHFIEDVKEKQKKEENRLLDLKNIRFQAQEKMEELDRIKRNLEQSIFKKIKELYELKDFGAFVHKIIGTKFPYENLPRIKSEHDIEQFTETLVQAFNLEFFDDTIKDLEKIDIYDKKSLIMENKIINGISDKESLEKEYINVRNNIDNELKQLKNSKLVLENDYNYLLKEIKFVKEQMKNFKLKETMDITQNLNYIQELGLEICSTIQNPPKCDEIYLNEFITYSKGIANVFRKTENKVNEMISNIENIINNGNKKDKELMWSLIINQKNKNKKEKQILFKQKEEETKMKQRLKIFNRDKKVILTGKKVIWDYPITTKHKLIIKNNIEIKNESNNNIDLEYSVSEEEQKLYNND